MQVHKAQDFASKRGKLLTDDFLFLVRKVLVIVYFMEDSSATLVIKKCYIFLSTLILFFSVYTLVSYFLNYSTLSTL